MIRFLIRLTLFILPAYMFGQSTLKEGQVDLSAFPNVKLQIQDRNPEILGEADFKIILDGKEIQPEVKPWEKELLHGKTLLILIEAHYLKERRNQLDFFKEVLQESINQLIGEEDRFAIAIFDWTRKDNQNKVLRFETDTFNSAKEDLSRIIKNIKPGSDLGLKEKSAEILLALNEGIELLSKENTQGKTILLLSSEYNNIYNSSISVGDLTVSARLRDIGIYTLRNPVGMAEKYNLRTLATESFGLSRTFELNEKDSAVAYLNRLKEVISSRAAGNSYELFFPTDLDKDGSYSKLEVVSKHGNINIEFNAPKANAKEIFFQYLYYWIGFFVVIFAVLIMLFIFYRKQKKKKDLKEKESTEQANRQKDVLESVQKAALKQEEELKKLKALKNEEALKEYLSKKQKEMLTYGPFPRLRNLKSGTEHIVNHYEFSIGRDSENCLQIEDTSASRSHALIHFLDGNYFIEDSGSTNGTFLNGIKLSEVKQILGDQDKITIGNHHFIYYR